MGPEEVSNRDSPQWFTAKGGILLLGKEERTLINLLANDDGISVKLGELLIPGLSIAKEGAKEQVIIA